MIAAWADEISATAWSVAVAVGPLAVLFMVFQTFLLKLPRRQVADILKGTLMAAAGLFLFLLGIGIGFLPFGRIIGETLGAMDRTWLFFVIGLLLGFFTTWGEPAVRILADQVEQASNGSIRRTAVLYAICAGVALWVGIGILRIAYEIPLQYLVVPGYAVAIVLMIFSDRNFVAIAADSGGVATGPLANTFLLALALGASASTDGRDPILYGLGFVALIALAPILSVMALGFIIRPARSKQEG